jgi:hypothetical protein
MLFEPRRAHWYLQRGVLGATTRGSQGDGLYVADNPPFGAVLTYHLAEGYPTLERSAEGGKGTARRGRRRDVPGLGGGRGGAS